MKNIIKTVWSYWDKTDRFVAIFSIIGIVLLILICCTSCNAQPSNVPAIEYNDVDVNNDNTLCDNCGILFFADGIIDFLYRAQDNKYIIEYDDPDAFDPDNMIYDEDFDYYYIEIYCDSAIFFDYLTYYSTLTNKDSAFFEASNTYFIKEDYMFDGDYDIPYYKLVKYDTTKNL